jgi:hypothetical protein
MQTQRSDEVPTALTRPAPRAVPDYTVVVARQDAKKEYSVADRKMRTNMHMTLAKRTVRPSTGHLPARALMTARFARCAHREGGSSVHLCETGGARGKISRVEADVQQAE